MSQGYTYNSERPAVGANFKDPQTVFYGAIINQNSPNRYTCRYRVNNYGMDDFVASVNSPSPQTPSHYPDWKPGGNYVTCIAEDNAPAYCAIIAGS